MRVSLIQRASRKPVLITGGAGFVGTNLAHRLMRIGRQVRIYDNLSRAGAQQNLRWLRAVHGSRLVQGAAGVYCKVLTGVCETGGNCDLRRQVEYRADIRKHSADICRVAHVTPVALLWRWQAGARPALCRRSDRCVLVRRRDRDRHVLQGLDQKMRYPPLILGSVLMRAVDAAHSEHSRTDGEAARIVEDILVGSALRAAIRAVEAERPHLVDRAQIAGRMVAN